MSISSCISPSSKLEADTTAEIHDNKQFPKPKTVQIFWSDNRSGEDITTLKVLRVHIKNIFGRGNYVFETILPVGNGERRGIGDLDVKDISKSGCIVVANGNNSGEDTLSPELEKFILKHPFATIIAVSANDDRIREFNARFKQLKEKLAAVYPIASPSPTTTQDAPLTPCYHS